MLIGDHNTEERVFVIAEIGNNHEGDAEVAKRLIERAAEAGVDAVKFQTIRADHFVSPTLHPERYQMLKRFELSDRQYLELRDAARNSGVKFMSTPFDLGAVELLDDLVEVFKIASGDNTFYPLLEAVARTGKPVILSTGLATFDEMHLTKLLLEKVWRERGGEQSLALLHCVTAYPTPAAEAQLREIPALRQRFDCEVGYSDHTLGTVAAVLAVAAGARIIEKHFTLDRNYSSFRDHRLSADPAEMEDLVRQIREATELMGSIEREVQDAEMANLVAVRRSIVAARDLTTGTILSPRDIAWMRPGGGVPPGREALLLGLELRAHVPAGGQITLDNLRSRQ